MKFKIFTTVTNQPSFAELQAKTFKEYLQCDYEFHIVDDSIGFSDEYEQICKDNNAVYHLKKEKIVPHNPMKSCAQAVQWTYDNLIQNCTDDIVLFLDSDMFLFQEFDPIEYMKNKIISGCLQTRGDVNYLWNGIVFLNMPSILNMNGKLNFDCGMVEDQFCDVGGFTYYFIKDNDIDVADLRPKFEGEYNGIQLENMETFMDGKFFHFRGGALWDGKVDVFGRKIEILQNILDTL
jgi:predicted glycosyltransferase involved in capsule biosynthesis